MPASAQPTPSACSTLTLSARLTPPQMVASHLPRPRLLVPMTTPGPTRLVLIRAAAGFGKSTLMQQYEAHCRAQREPALWLNLDLADNDLSRFIRHLTEGLLRLGLIAAPTHPASAVSQDQSLLDLLGQVPPPFSLLLDEFEVIQNPQVQDFVRQIIDALPSGARLVVASRVTPSLGLGRLRARGHLCEITPAALRFSLTEASTYLREKHALPLRDSDIATLHRCTEGWAAALFLATLSLHDRSDHAEFVASFSGTNLELAEYLAEDILARQPARHRQFLLETSVLGQLCAPLCDAVTGRSDSQAMIDHLQQANLFLFPLDHERHWYRYHSLFASFLTDALERQSPGRARALHDAAAQWYLQAARPVRAIDHLLQAGHTAQAAHLLADQVETLMDAGRSRLLLRWLDQIPLAELVAQPRLLVAYAWTLVLARRFRDATTILQRLDDGVGNTHAHHVLEAETVRCLLLVMTEQVEACYEAGLRLLARLPDTALFQIGVVTNTVALSMLATERYDEARSLLSRALRHHNFRRSTYLRSLVDSLEGIIDLVQGRLGAAQACQRGAAERHAANASDEALGGRFTTRVILALALYETDELDDVDAILREAMPYLHHSTPDQLIVSHSLLARLAWLRGDHEQSQRHLVELEQLGQRIGNARVICSSWQERARLALLEGRLAQARQAQRIADTMSDWEQPGLSMYGTDVELPSISRWRLRMASGDAAACASELPAAIAQAQAKHLHRRALKLRLLHALALEHQGERAGALTHLSAALHDASHEGFRRTFLDEGPAMTQLLQRWADTHAEPTAANPREAQFVAELLARSGVTATRPAAHPANGTATTTHLEALTQRETEVLHLLAQGHRNRGIAEQLHLSEFTVKSHLRNINAKLNAQGRTEAVAIARQRGLLA